MSPSWLRRIIILSVAVGACYETKAMIVTVRTTNTRLDCFEIADQTFSNAGYARMETVQGPERFYTPRTAPTTSDALALHWGIAVSVQSGKGKYDERGRCEFALQALSREEGCGMQCPLTPQRGTDYDRSVNDMAGQLTAAFGEKRAVE
jgi:hypothetical protein